MIPELLAAVFLFLALLSCAHSLDVIATTLKYFRYNPMLSTRGIEMELERIRKEIDKLERRQQGVGI